MVRRVLGSVEWQRLRRRILASATVCAICGHALQPDAPPLSPWSSSVDHRIPLARFAHDPEMQWRMGLDEANCRATHLRCNQRRGAALGAKRTTRGRSRDWFGNGGAGYGATRRTSRKW
jgi:5-methylcytosine-specific restriction endonuclease McrA